MDSQTSELTVIFDDYTLQQLKDEIKQEMCKIVNNANFSKILTKHGILRQEVLQFEYRIDLNKLQSPNLDEDKKDQNFLLPNDCSNCTCTCWSRQLREWIPCPCNEG